MSEVILPYNWKPRNYQVPAWVHFENGGKRGVCVWHRRCGKDLMGLNLCATKMLERTGVYWHLLPTYKQGRAIVWNGFTKEGRPFIDHFPKELIASKNKTEMSITYTTGSIYQVVGTDNIDSLVGTNPIGCIFSEYSLQDPGAWDLIRPILAENGGWALFIYTARGHNHGYRLFNMAKRNPEWFCEALVAGDKGTKREDGTPVVSDAIIQGERDADMPEPLIQQEFYCNFDAPLVGAYYGAAIEKIEKAGRIGAVGWEPRLVVNTYWDIGIGDATAIWFVQSHGFEHRLIDYYEMSGEGIAHYANLLRGQVDGYERMKEYNYGVHWGPWDLGVKEMGTGKTRLETARSLGLKFRIMPQLRVEDRIEASRNIIPMCWFDSKYCERGIDALKSYRKEVDEKAGTGNPSIKFQFRDVPVHDWASHGADAFGIFALMCSDRSRTSRREKQKENADDTYQYT